MTPEQIKEKIDANNLMIRTLMKPNSFVLNPMIASLLKENLKLQQECKHEFENGKCIYCYMEEKDCL